MASFAAVGVEAVVKNVGGFVKDMGRMDSAIEQTGSKSGAMGAKAVAMGSLMAGAVSGGVSLLAEGVADLGREFGNWIRQASEAQAIEAQLDQVLASTGGTAGMTKEAILGLATALSQVTPFEDDLIVQTETMLLQFKNIGEEVFPQATEMALDLATRLGIDATSAAKLLGKALEEPGEGLARLKQAGIAFSDEQTKMIESMVAAGDTAGAQAYIMDQLATSVGGAARAAGDTFAGKMEILKNQFTNIKEQIGTALLPALTSIADKILEVLARPEVQAAIQQFADWLAVNLPIAIDTIVAFIENDLVPAIQKIATWIQTKFIPAVKDIYNWLSVNVPAAIETVGKAFDWVKTNILNPVESAFNAIGDAIQWVIDKVQTLIDWLNELGDSVPDWAKPGSPTPFEIGLRGITAAMRELQSLPAVVFAPPRLAMAGATSETNNTYGGDTYNVSAQSRESWAMAQSWMDSRRQERLNMGM